MELVKFKDRDDLINEQASDIAEGVIRDLLPAFQQMKDNGDITAKPDVISYFLCMYLAEFLLTMGWTVQQLQDGILISQRNVAADPEGELEF